ncbi:MAG: hypothetical protein MPL62_00305 [Alphaproteobacteria bacterium]|nr:hypothetical protein [Alphaproteobacteria bacterium]
MPAGAACKKIKKDNDSDGRQCRCPLSLSLSLCALTTDKEAGAVVAVVKAWLTTDKVSSVSLTTKAV